MTLPCRWRQGGLGAFAGRVRFRRRFGYPGRIDDTERVWLTFGGIEGAATVWLNGQLLGQPDHPENGFEYEVTSLLRERNELVVEVDGPAGGGVWGEVALEVRRTAFLRDVLLLPEPGPRLRICGNVVGVAERPLELYAILDRSSVGYTTVEPLPEGRPFTLLADALGLEGKHSLRLDLVDGSVVWYTLELSVDFPATGQPG
jgi:hypothetical protein